MRVTGALLLFLVSWLQIAAASPVTYYFEAANGTRFQYDAPGLVPNGNQLYRVYQEAMNFCVDPGGDCESVIFVTNGANDALIFDEPFFGVLFPENTLNQIGAALTLPGSQTDGRITVYERSPGYVYEYFFKDSTGERTFRFLTPRMLVSDIDLALALLQSCTSSPGTVCEPPQLEFDLASEFDAIRFTESGSNRSYLFPRLAFTTLGIHETDGGLYAGVLRVSYIRDPLDPPPPPGGGSEVPEPASVALTGVGIGAVLWLSRRGRGRGNRR